MRAFKTLADARSGQLEHAMSNLPREVVLATRSFHLFGTTERGEGAAIVHKLPWSVTRSTVS